MQDLRKNKIRSLVLALTAIGIALRVVRLSSREFWNDEIYQFQCMVGPFKAFWLRQIYGDHTAFPGEYILNYPFVSFFGMNKWWLAVPHFFVMLLGFWFLYRLCQRFRFEWPGYLAAFLVYALNKNLIFHALEFRPYAALPILALAAFYFLGQLFDYGLQHWNWWQRMSLAVFLVVVMNYHVYGIMFFILPIFYFVVERALAAARGGRGWGGIFPTKAVLFFLTAVFIVGTLIWLWYASYSHCGLSPNNDQTRTDPFQFINNPVTAPMLFSIKTLGNFAGSRLGDAFMALAAISFLFPRRFRTEQFAFLVVMVVLPVLLILYFDLRNSYWFVQRQFVWAMPFCALFIGWCSDTLYERAKGFRILKSFI